MGVEIPFESSHRAVGFISDELGEAIKQSGAIYTHAAKSYCLNATGGGGLDKWQSTISPISLTVLYLEAKIWDNTL